MILRDKYAKDLTEDGWIVTCIPCSQAKGRKRGILNMLRPFSIYNWKNHCVCDHHSNAVANLITEEETRGKQNKNRNIQSGLTTFFAKISDNKPRRPTTPTPPSLPDWGGNAYLTVAIRYVVACVWYYINYMFTFSFILKAYYMEPFSFYFFSSIFLFQQS